MYIKRHNYCNVLIHFSVALRLSVELDLSLCCALNKEVTQPSAVKNAVGERSVRDLKLRFPHDRELSFMRQVESMRAIPPERAATSRTPGRSLIASRTCVCLRGRNLAAAACVLAPERCSS